MAVVKKIYGKMYTFDRTVDTKRDAEELARDWKRDGDKIAVARKINVECGSKQLGTYKICKKWAVFWRRA